jgi:hypothetical protein
MKRLIQSAAVLALAASAFAVGPVAATTPAAPASAYGNTVECRYRAEGSGPAFDWRLNKLGVTAPKVYAKSGTQTVGWRFVVTRSMNYSSGPWNITYRSPLQKRTATTSKPAAFTAMSVGVNLPDVENFVSVQYRVTLKLTWYRANGTVQSQTSYLMPYMEYWQNREYQHDWTNACTAGYYQGP